MDRAHFGLISLAVLAGGTSSRMGGANKAFAEIQGRPLVEHILARVKGLADETLIIANAPDRYAHLGLPIHTDAVLGKGTLVGIYSAVYHAQGAHTLVVACDMPFLSRDLLTFLLSLRQGYDVVAPRLEGYPQATHAVYGKACLGPIRAKIEAGHLKAIGFYDQVRVRYVDEAEMRPFDPDLCSFVNVNTLEELDRARRSPCGRAIGPG